MDYITKEINKNFKNKYEYLQLLEVVYDLENKVCKVIFLYPENIFDVDESIKTEITDFVTNLLGLSAKLDLKFKKSFLDEELISKHINNYFRSNNVSLFSSLNEENICVKNNRGQINVTLNFPNDMGVYVEENNIVWKLKENLEKNFIATFLIELNKTNQQLDESILEKRKTELPSTSGSKITPRYLVTDVNILIGKEITPQPEFVSNQRSDRQSVILAGKILNLAKKEYKNKKSKDENATKTFYSFDLTDISGSISCIHFASKTNEPKLDKLENGNQVLIVGDIRPNLYGKLNCYIKNISLCKIDEQKAVEDKKQAEKENIELKKEFQYVFPHSYSMTKQGNLFDFGSEFTDIVSQNTIVSFDVETTGLEPESAEIIEIGAAKIVKGEIVETFQTLIKPKKEIPSLITEITGIDNQMVKDAPTAAQAIADFILFVEGTILTGYNVNFDMRFIQAAAGEIGFRFNNKVEDTMTYAKSKLFLGNYTLKNVAKNLDVSLKEAHRALNDALATAKVFLALNKK